MKSKIKIIRDHKSCEALLSIAAEMAWDGALRQVRLKAIHAEIDDALEKSDEEAFMRLTAELKQLKEG